jgi:hypothetical protein
MSYPAGTTRLDHTAGTCMTCGCTAPARVRIDTPEAGGASSSVYVCTAHAA